MKKLPTFKYHPNPIASGVIQKKSAICLCCTKQVEYVYVGPCYSIHDLDEPLCPWCIADGSAHEKFKVQFCDDYALHDAGIAKEIIKEVATLTPGYSSWQSEVWLSHCNDACAFMGDASIKTFQNMTTDELSSMLRQNEMDESLFRMITKHYEPGGSPAIYHFRCLHCGINLFNLDYT